MNAAGRRRARRKRLKLYYDLCEELEIEPGALIEFRIPIAVELWSEARLGIATAQLERHAKEVREDAPLAALIYEELK